MRKITLPNWFNELPSHANLNALDIKHLFGYSKNTEISQLVQDKSIPEPDWKSKGVNGGYGRPLWSKKYLKRMIGACE